MDRLTDKIGGVPVWVWGVIIGGLVVVWTWVSRRGSSGAAPASGAANISSEEATALNGALQGLSSGSNPLTSGVPSAAEPGETRSNDWWLNQSLVHVLSLGASPLTAQRALQKYLQGQPLTEAEAKIINQAVTKYGLPPQGVSDIPTVEPSTPAPTQSTRKLVKFIRMAGRDTVYAYYSDGSRQGLTRAQFLALGGATAPITVLPSAAAEWQGPDLPPDRK